MFDFKDRAVKLIVTSKNGVALMEKLSKRQEMIFDFIKSEVDVKGYPPSVREIAKAVGLASSSTVHGHLKRIEEKGFIRRDPTKPRAIEIIDQAMENNIERDAAR